VGFKLILLSALKVFAMKTAVQTEWTALQVSEPSKGVYHVQFNRPKKLNTMNDDFFRDIRDCFGLIHNDANCRAIVVSGNGKCFTAGLALGGSSLAGLMGSKQDKARKTLAFREHVLELQNTFNAVENCPQPVIAAVHGAVIGGGIDFMTCCDIRYCSADAFFSVKEVDIGIAADLGTLSRLPKVIGNHSLMRELCYTARKFTAQEALACGLVSKIGADLQSTVADALATAATIATKSPLAVTGTKHNLLYSRDHSVADGLQYVASWNGSALQTEDFMKAVQAFVTKKKVEFAPLVPTPRL